MKEYYVYILLCRDSSYYIGVTNDYVRRLAEHQSGISSMAYTFKRRPVTLVYVSVFRDIDQAIEWEAEIKRWSRAKKEALINQEFETLHDLSACQNFSHSSYYDIECHTERSRSVIRVLLINNVHIPRLRSG